MTRPKASPRYTRIDITGEPVVGCAIWFEFDEIEIRELAAGVISTRVREGAQGCVKLLDGPWPHV